MVANLKLFIDRSIGAAAKKTAVYGQMCDAYDGIAQKVLLQEPISDEDAQKLISSIKSCGAADVGCIVSMLNLIRSPNPAS